jgi:hypothetical protein
VNHDYQQKEKAWRIKWDPKQTELENYRRIDIESTSIYFNPMSLVFCLAKKEFDIGIGGLMLADSTLFRSLEIPYIKISEEDIEASVMQIKLQMPVLTSSYPNAQIWD